MRHFGEMSCKAFILDAVMLTFDHTSFLLDSFVLTNGPLSNRSQLQLFQLIPR